MNDFRFEIHRGSREIGGSCVEVSLGDRRIILDVGFPLFDRKREPLDGRSFQKADTSELRAHEILPPAPGLFVDDNRPAPDAVIITHPHQDHYGLIPHVKPEVPIYLGKTAARLVELSGIFLPFAPQPPAGFRTYESGKPLHFGKLMLTPFLVDHSAFDAHAFLVEGGSKRLLYTGDFRRHGRKRATIDYLAKKARGVDYLLMEGTNLGKPEKERAHDLQTESDVEKRLVSQFRAADGLALVYASAQNIDRIVSVYRAAVQAGRTLVVDVYTASVLEAIAEERKTIPHPRRFPLRVVFPWYTTTRLFRNGHERIAFAVRHAKLRWPEISVDPGKYVLTVRPSMREIAKLNLGKSPVLIYSQWNGYKDEPATKKFLDELEGRGCRVVDVHVSGHAYPQALQDFQKAVGAKELVPIHTMVPERYGELFG